MKKILTLLFLIASLTIQAQYSGYPKFQGGHFYMWYAPTGWINCDSMMIRLMGIKDTADVLRQLIVNSAWDGRFYNLEDTGIILTTTVNKPLIIGIPDAFSVAAHFQYPGAPTKFVDICYPYPHFGINISNMGFYLQTSGHLTGYDPIYISATAGGQFDNVFKYDVSAVNKFRVDSAGKVVSADSGRFTKGVRAPGYYNMDGTAAETFKRKLVSITSSNILNGDSISILPAPGSDLVDILINISGLFIAGTPYTKTGTDTTWIYTYEGTTPVKITYLLDTFILNTATSVAYAPVLSPNASLNKPIWIRLATGFADGTGTLKIVLYYKRENFN